MNITRQLVEEVVNTMEDSEAGEVIVPVEQFWAHFGAVNSMQTLQQEITSRLAEEGHEVSFEVVISYLEDDLPFIGVFDAPAHSAPVDLTADTLRALSIQQPWVEMILHGEKNLEYRSRRVREMGPLLLHASGTRRLENFSLGTFAPEVLTYGALVGVVDVVGVQAVEGEDGLYAWQLAHPRRFRNPVAYSGAAGIFRVPVQTVREALGSATTPGVPL